jgi:DNA-directed RNA polymerase specialized sigma24 family protein
VSFAFAHSKQFIARPPWEDRRPQINDRRLQAEAHQYFSGRSAPGFLLLNPRKGTPIAWLTGIARRCISEAYAAPSGSEDELPDVAASGDLEHQVVERDELAGAIRRLGERDRELIALRYGADLSARQIGDVLGIQTNAVEVALHRALGRLRSSLEGGAESP